jgi:DNA-binding NarL/FixJ family response regulator
MVRAGTTLSFLQACRSQSPAALVLDVRLPWHSPALVCRLVRSQPETLRVPLLVLESAEGSGRSCLEAGADQLLPPGAPVDQVVSRLRELLPGEPAAQAGGGRL